MKPANVEAETSRLPELLRRAAFDLELKRMLFEEPAQAAHRFGLDNADLQRLRRLSPTDLDAVLGRLVRYKLAPLPIGQRLWIVPDGGVLPSGGDRIEIVIDQSATGAMIGTDGTSARNGQVFGSGTHPTTRLCIQLLERHLKPGMRMLDIGTGSGILALTAAKLGAGQVLGLDIDPDAVATAQRNVHRNAEQSIVKLYVGGVEWLRANASQPFDLMVANILAGIHLQSIQQGLLEHLAPGGRVILSGMHRAGAVAVAQALYQAGAQQVAYSRQGSWYALTTTLENGTDC